MRSTFRNLIGVCIAAFGLCFTGFGFADERPDIISYVLASCGDHGAEAAKFKAEQTYMVSLDSVRTSLGSSLTAESNGYRLSELVVAAVNDSEVAKGKLGVSAGAVA